MNVEIGIVALQLLVWEYLFQIFVTGSLQFRGQDRWCEMWKIYFLHIALFIANGWVNYLSLSNVLSIMEQLLAMSTVRLNSYSSRSSILTCSNRSSLKAQLAEIFCRCILSIFFSTRCSVYSAVVSPQMEMQICPYTQIICRRRLPDGKQYKIKNRALLAL